MQTNRIERFKAEVEGHAKESMEVESLGSALYAFGSELATLRLWKKYNGAPNARQGFSENQGRFYFSLELAF